MSAYRKAGFAVGLILGNLIKWSAFGIGAGLAFTWLVLR